MHRESHASDRVHTLIQWKLIKQKRKQTLREKRCISRTFNITLFPRPPAFAPSFWSIGQPRPQGLLFFQYREPWRRGFRGSLACNSQSIKQKTKVLDFLVRTNKMSVNGKETIHKRCSKGYLSANVCVRNKRAPTLHCVSLRMFEFEEMCGNKYRTVLR